MASRDRDTLPRIPFAVSICCWAAGCALSGAADLREDPTPGFQDLDGGDGWASDGGTDSDSGSEPWDTETQDPADDSDSGEGEADADCLDLEWDSYQVSGTCPGLPPTGSIEQPEGCAILIPGELGAHIGPTGTVEGTLVTTERCSGIGAILAAPKVELICVIESVSCEVLLSGSASNSP